MKILAVNNKSNNNYYRNRTQHYSYMQNTVSFSASRTQRNEGQKAIAFISAVCLAITGGIAVARQNNYVDAETTQPQSDYSCEIEIEPEIKEPEKQKEPSAEEILETEVIIKEQYEKLSEAIETYSEHLGEDALPLIIKKIEEIGNGTVELIDVLKTLWIESNGRIYDDSGEILKSGADAYGAFQVTKDTQDYLNNYFKVNLDVENPYDNLDACIYNLRFLHEKRSKDMEEGKQLPTGDNLKKAIAWSYHDGAWATKISYYGQDYINKYTELSLIDQYPQVIEYIINSGE